MLRSRVAVEQHSGWEKHREPRTCRPPQELFFVLYKRLLEQLQPSWANSAPQMPADAPVRGH